MRTEFIEELEKDEPDINGVMRRLTEEIDADRTRKKNELFEEYQQVVSIAFVLSHSDDKNSKSYRLAKAMIEELKEENIKESKNDSK